MKNYLLLFGIFTLSFLASCGDSDFMKTQDKLEGEWEVTAWTIDGFDALEPGASASLTFNPSDEISGNYDFSECVIENGEEDCYSEIENYKLLEDGTQIDIEDLGSGSLTLEGDNLTIDIPFFLYIMKATKK